MLYGNSSSTSTRGIGNERISLFDAADLVSRHGKLRGGPVGIV